MVVILIKFRLFFYIKLTATSNTHANDIGILKFTKIFKNFQKFSTIIYQSLILKNKDYKSYINRKLFIE